MITNIYFILGLIMFHAVVIFYIYYRLSFVGLLRMIFFVCFFSRVNLIKVLEHLNQCWILQVHVSSLRFLFRNHLLCGFVRFTSL